MSFVPRNRVITPPMVMYIDDDTEMDETHHLPFDPVPDTIERPKTPVIHQLPFVPIPDPVEQARRIQAVKYHTEMQRRRLRPTSPPSCKRKL